MYLSLYTLKVDVTVGYMDVLYIKKKKAKIARAAVYM